MTYIPLPTSRTTPAADALGVVTRAIGTTQVQASGTFPVKPAAMAYRRINTVAETLVKEGAGMLYKLIFNTPTNYPVTLYDSLSASGTVMGVVQPGPGSQPFSLDYGIPFATGLMVKTAGSPDMLVVYE